MESWNISSTYPFTDSNSNSRSSSAEHHCFGVLLLIVSVCGLVVNMLVIVFTFTNSVAKQQVCILFANGACGDALFLIILAFWVSPMIIFQTSIANNMFVLATAFSASVFTSLFLAGNRFTAVHFPLEYRSLFNARHTKHYVIGIWIAAWILSIPYGFPGCKCYVDFVNYRMEYEDGLCGNILCIFSLCIFPAFTITVFSLNIATFIKMKSLRRSQKQHRGFVDADAERKRRRENQFFYQAVSIALSMDTLVLSFNLLSRLSHNRWWTYFTTMFYLSLMLTMNGLINLLLNDEARLQLLRVLCFWKKSLKIQRHAMRNNPAILVQKAAAKEQLAKVLQIRRATSQF